MKAQNLTPQPHLSAQGESHAERGEGKVEPLLVIGLGNPLLGDDGVGWHVAEQVAHELDESDKPVEVDCLAVGGLGLMERLAGYHSAIIVDAIVTGQQPSGSLSCFSLDDLLDDTAGHLHSTHDTSLHVALRAGAALGIPLPCCLTVVGIEACRVYDFDERLSPAVAACVPLAVKTVLDLLNQFDQEKHNL
jgi:hydrogenase maturation protease